ncbi:hypothetical protein DXG01_012587 [Tephrocybe rancida]|nr:hypothetical protein DXG01_012587 [Tephrocybe rancida]
MVDSSRMGAENDSFIQHGQHIPQSVDTFDELLDVVAFGRRISAQLNHGQLTPTFLNDSELFMWRSYCLLLPMIPQPKGLIVNTHRGELQRISHLIRRGLATTRMEDERILRAKLTSWLSLESSDTLGLQGLEKRRGFNHPTTGSLLCPPNIIWDDPK